jgi:hypothetical protein
LSEYSKNKLSNLEEITALGRSERRELENRLEVLLMHLLKRSYVNSPEDYRGWELTIKEQSRRIKRLLRDSPSLKKYFVEIFAEIWQEARSDVNDFYPTSEIPNDCPFNSDLEEILNNKFGLK